MECKHGLTIGCAPCAARGQAPVFMSKGGDVYHSRERCQAFMEGHRKADAALHNVYDLQRVSRLDALMNGRRPCGWCCSEKFLRAS